jgi:ubiquinone/menaquinone biosynthesis C-methylase UbiE
MTTTNDYDRFAARRQEQLKKGELKPHKYVEKPAMKSILPRLEGQSVLLVGCGTGEETTLLEEHGGANMVGIDNSEKSIELAAASYPEHHFKTGDMHNLEFDDDSFDFVYSSLAIHYSETPITVFLEISRVLRQGGKFQFSVAHPVRWASVRIDIDGVPTKVLGYTEGDGEVKRYGNYSDYKQYSETFPTGETLTFWVGPPSMYFNLLKEAGFTVNEFIETRAIEDVKSVDNAYYERYHYLPQFTVFQATKL